MAVPEAKYKKIRIYDCQYEFEPLFLNVDFKDIDLFYYLYIRYTQCIYPALEKMWEPMDFLPEQKDKKEETEKLSMNQSKMTKKPEIIVEVSEEKDSSHDFLNEEEKPLNMTEESEDNYLEIDYTS